MSDHARRATQFAGLNLQVDPDYTTTSNAPQAQKQEETGGQSSRAYHTYSDEVYFLPNDSTEHSRLDLQDQIWNISLHGGNYISPLESSIKHALEIGAGTGKWMNDFARAFPDCHVLGTDLTPVNPTTPKPSNAEYIVANANQPWDFQDQTFDFIHSRLLILGITDWKQYFAQAYKHVRPGGWVEAQEPEFPFFYVDNGNVTADSPLLRFSHLCMEAMDQIGLNARTCDILQDTIKGAGFINVRAEKIRWAAGPWTKDPRDKEVGRLFEIDLRDGLIPLFATKLFGGVLGWSEDRVNLFVKEVIADLEDPKTHYWIELTVFCGQKSL